MKIEQDVLEVEQLQEKMRLHTYLAYFEACFRDKRYFKFPKSSVHVERYAKRQKFDLSIY